jgi:hypothetical protein
MRVTEETLVLYYYRELGAEAAREVRAQLMADAELSARYAALSAELDSLPELSIPERDENYGRRVWARVDIALDERGSRTSWRMKPSSLFNGFHRSLRWASGFAVLGVVAVLAFQVGRMTPPDIPVSQFVSSLPTAGDARQARLFQASLNDHFESAERLLVELSNQDFAEIDIESEKSWATTLLVANRLYRFAAQQSGQHRIAMLLADMEPVLIQLAIGAGELTPDEYRMLQQSIEERDLLFKVRSTNFALQSQEFTL